MRKQAKFKCKKCKTTFKSIEEISVEKTWHVVSPIPDKNGNITINVMATWICPVCGHKNRGKITSIKSGERIAGRSPTQKLVDIINRHKEISIKELSIQLGVDEETIQKALRYLIKKKMINAEIKNNIVKVR